MRRKWGSPLHSSIKCLTILLLFILFWYVIYNFSGVASKLQLNQRLAFGKLNNMLLISHFSFEMNYLNNYFSLISNIFLTAKYLMAVASSTSSLQESYFFLQLLYPCFAYLLFVFSCSYADSHCIDGNAVLDQKATCFDDLVYFGRYRDYCFSLWKGRVPDRYTCQTA